MSTCNQLDLQTLGPQLVIMPTFSPTIARYRWQKTVFGENSSILTGGQVPTPAGYMLTSFQFLFR